MAVLTPDAETPTDWPHIVLDWVSATRKLAHAFRTADSSLVASGELSSGTALAAAVDCQLAITPLHARQWPETRLLRPRGKRHFRG
jgi:hypothetical protein